MCVSDREQHRENAIHNLSLRQFENKSTYHMHYIPVHKAYSALNVVAAVVTVVVISIVVDNIIIIIGITFAIHWQCDSMDVWLIETD